MRLLPTGPHSMRTKLSALDFPQGEWQDNSKIEHLPEHLNGQILKSGVDRAISVDITTPVDEPEFLVGQDSDKARLSSPSLTTLPEAIGLATGLG